MKFSLIKIAITRGPSSRFQHLAKCVLCFNLMILFKIYKFIIFDEYVSYFAQRASYG